MTILRNSLRYLPVVVGAVEHDENVEHALADRLGSVLQAILVYALHGSASDVEGIRSDLACIASDETIRTEVMGNAHLALDHANRILDYKPRVDAETNRILASAAEDALDELAAAFDGWNRIAAFTGNVYRFALIALCTLLALGLAHFVYRLRLVMESLRQANDHLEQRVQARTADLSRANTELETQIAERQRAIAELVSAQARIQQILSIMPSVLIGTDGDQRIVLWNSRAEVQFGISASQAIGCPLEECGITWDFTALRSRLAGIEQAPIHLADVPYTRPGGQPGLLAVSASLLPSEREAGMLLAATDVTSSRSRSSPIPAAASWPPSTCAGPSRAPSTWRAASTSTWPTWSPTSPATCRAWNACRES